MHSVFLTFNSKPFSILLTVVVARSVRSFCSESAMSTVSSAHRKLLISLPPTLTPLLWVVSGCFLWLLTVECYFSHSYYF